MVWHRTLYSAAKSKKQKKMGKMGKMDKMDKMDQVEPMVTQRLRSETPFTKFISNPPETSHQ